MSIVLERLKQTVSGLDRTTVLQVATRWRGRGVELLAKLSAQMSQSPFKAMGVIVVVNGLFYILVSRRLVDLFDNCFKQSDQAQPKIWVGVVVLGSLTALINIGFSKLMQTTLSRFALLVITSSVIFLRLFFNSEIAALPSRRNGSEIRPTRKPQQRYIAHQPKLDPQDVDKAHHQLLFLGNDPDTSKEGTAEPSVINLNDFAHLTNFGYTNQDLILFIKFIHYPAALSQFNAFIQSVPVYARPLLSTTEEKIQLMFVIASEFMAMEGRHSSSELRLEQVLKRISDEILNMKSVSLVQSESVQWFLVQGFTRFQLATLLAAVAEEQGPNVLDRLHQFVNNLQQMNNERALNMDAKIMSNLLDAIIHQFNRLTMNSQSAHFYSFQILDILFKIHESKFQYEASRALMGCSSQGEVASSDQDRHLDYVEQNLLPLFTKSVNENFLLLSQIIEEFNVAMKTQEVTSMEHAHRLFLEVCDKRLNLQMKVNCQDLLSYGLNQEQLAILFALVGDEHQNNVMRKLADFVRWFYSDELRGSGQVLEITPEKGNNILQKIIKDFEYRKTSTSPTQFSSIKTFEEIIEMYKTRLENETYQELINKVPQTLIDDLINIFSEYNGIFRLIDHFVLVLFKTHLLPLLNQSSQENITIVQHIQSEFDQLRKSQQVNDQSGALGLFGDVCERFQKGQNT